MLWGTAIRRLLRFRRKLPQSPSPVMAVSKTFNLAGLQASSVIFNNREEKDKFEKILAQPGDTQE